MSKLLYQQLWASADILRGKMDASEYKNYLLGLIFYKYLSDKQLRKVYEIESGVVSDYPSTDELYSVFKKWYDEDKDNLILECKNLLDYFIEPQFLFHYMRLNEHEFRLNDLTQAFVNLSQENAQFLGLFDDIDLNSTKLGITDQQKNICIISLIKTLDEIDLFGHEGDVIGDAYEYLISVFASSAGKKGGEFYTPQAVSKIISKIVSLGHENKNRFNIYDPTMGSGSLMLNIARYITNENNIYYCGQELNHTTYNLAKMNFILHGIENSRIRVSNGDTLDADWPATEPIQFDGVVMNPPYSQAWSANDKFLSDSRFEKYGKLAPKSKADYAFLLHGFYHLKDNGTMGIVLPHGVLFRGASEGMIRKTLIDDGSIDAVIGLPANIFYGTSIPTVVLILKKNRNNRDVLFIDASKDFEKQKNQNFLTDENIDKIVQGYLNRGEIEKYSHLATYDEIVKNDYNLNIPRYVDTFEKEEEINIIDVSNDIISIDGEIKAIETELLAMLSDLVSEDGSDEIIIATKKVFGNE